MDELGQETPRDVSSADSQAAYRCVCGEMIPLDSATGKCPQCGRHYDSDVLRDPAAETVLLAAGDVDPDTPTGLTTAHEVDDFVGSRLGHFQILERIGEGGMGGVYRALDESLQRYVALKVMRRAAGGGDDSNSPMQQLFQEARAQARVNHANVAHIYFVGTDGETPFLAMELVGHQTLAQRLQQGALPFPTVARFALQIAEALAHAAKFDIVHGDVKPSNVLLVDDGNVKISDFGLARRFSELAPDDGTVAGTPNYVAPEVTNGQSADHRSDLYSLGVTLFEMTFGRLPYDFGGRTLADRLALHREASVDFPVPWPSGLPEGWRDVLTRLLFKDPAERYTDFEQLIADLRKLQPASLPTASPLLRGLAWMLDGMLISLPLVFIAYIFRGNTELPKPLVMSALFGGAITGGVSLLQSWWGTTPGKKLFQIRIVDQHGLRPARSVLGVRAVFQFLWAWAMVAGDLLLLVNLRDIGQALSALASLFLFVEMGFVVFGRGRSLHDRFLRTRVVLDASKS